MARPKGSHGFNWKKNPEIDKRLDEIYRGRYNQETADILNREFGTNLTGPQVSRHLKSQGKSCGLGKGHNKDRPSFWTPEKEAFVAARLDKTYDEILDDIEREFGVRVTEGALGHFKWKRGLYSENDGRYAPGHLPANVAELGAEGNKGNGYVWVKVSDERHTGNGSARNWKPKTKVLYEAEHGPLPKGMVVTFRDGDENNYSIDNLVAVNRMELGYMSKMGTKRMEPEVRETGELVCRLKAKIHEKEKHDEHK